MRKAPRYEALPSRKQSENSSHKQGRRTKWRRKGWRTKGAVKKGLIEQNSKSISVVFVASRSPFSLSVLDAAALYQTGSKSPPSGGRRIVVAKAPLSTSFVVNAFDRPGQSFLQALDREGEATTIGRQRAQWGVGVPTAA